jgi:heme/copper-type cytochrome/quinol oxidase subunit 2
MISVITLAVGASIRRMEVAELRSALLGAASVLLALPLSQAAISQSWDVATTIITLLGVVLLIAGLIVSLSIEQRNEGP